MTKSILADALGHDLETDAEIAWPDVPTASISILEYTQRPDGNLDKKVESVGVKPELLESSSGDAWGG